MSENFIFSVRDEKVEQVEKIKKAFEIAGINFSNWIVCIIINQFVKEEWEDHLERLQEKRK